MTTHPIAGHSQVLYNCYTTRNREVEQFVASHIFSYQESGTLTIDDGKKQHVCEAGDFRFIKRNQLLKFIKTPPEQGVFSSVSIFMDQDLLGDMRKEQSGPPHRGPASVHTCLALKNHPLYRSFIDSLLVYLQLPVEEQRALVHIKVREAVQLLLQVNPETRYLLADFSEPGKIDLEAFMLEHFHFNVELKRFAYLTGRSLSTFKRDFEHIFHMTPARWLTQQRLSRAHYLIREQGRMPSEVYFEVGFKDLSHFSFAFKKQFGVSPSQLA